MTNEDKIKKWLSDELSDSDKKEFESTETFAKINRLMNASKAFKAPQYNIEKEYSKLSDNLLHNKKTNSLYKKLNPIFRIAASIIIIFSIGYFSYTFLNNGTQNQEWISEQSEVYLPDSSCVLLNTDSKIRYTNKEWGKERNVELSGEAFFKVKKGSHFNVKTQQGVVSVLGTEFNIKDRDNYYEVTCYSGLVKVTTETNSLVLKPNKSYRIIKDKEEYYSIANKQQPEWIDGESHFNSIPLRFVITEFQRQYKVKITTKNVNLDQLFTGSFTHRSLELAIQSITIPVNLNYNINGKQIVLTVERN